jgi:hypothetical protein
MPAIPPPQCSYRFECEYDINRLAYAVAVAESGDCTAGKSLRTNNCHSIGEAVYESPAESYAAFTALWRLSYGDTFPDRETAHKYVVGPGRTPEGSSWHALACRWIRNVAAHY